jgi:hypothetical protein
MPSVCVCNFSMQIFVPNYQTHMCIRTYSHTSARAHTHAHTHPHQALAEQLVLRPEDEPGTIKQAIDQYHGHAEAIKGFYREKVLCCAPAATDCYVI